MEQSAVPGGKCGIGGILMTLTGLLRRPASSVMAMGLTMAAAFAQGAPAPMKPGDAPTSGWSAEVAAPGTSSLTLDDKQVQLVNSVSSYFAGIENLKGAFVQTGADQKRMRGKFYVKRPGRFRFDYALPSKQIVVSDGEYLAIQDLDLNNEDRVELNQTPFRLLLRKDVDLLRDAKIVEVQEADDLIVLALTDKSPDTPGTIKLFMSKSPQLELKEWVTTDAQGLDTRVQVSGLDTTEQLDVKMFKIQMLGAHRATP